MASKVEATEAVTRLQSLSEAEIDAWLKTDEVQTQIRAINTGKTKSWRFDMYNAGPPKKRAQLKEHISHAILNEYCPKEAINYVLDVLVPEAIIKLIMDKTGLDYDQADELSTQFELSGEVSGRVSVSEEPSAAQVASQVSRNEGTIQAATSGDCVPQGLREFSASEIMSATGNMSELIGKGGFGRVYKGSYHHLDIAVKILNTEVVGDVGECLKKEALALVRFCHPNIIQLMGYCSSPPSLVYPYMCRQSLHYLLHEYKFRGLKPLTWAERVSILVDAACGLCYLHSSTPPYIHQDIKSSNILLRSDLRAVIADFGFVSALPECVGSTTVVTAVGAMSLAWSRGYLAPEVTDGKHGVSTDVYSYGVVVLESFTRLLAYSEQREDSKLVDHCEDKVTTADDFSTIADPGAGAIADTVLQAFYCVVRGTIQRRHKRRLTISQVLDKWK